MKDRIIKFLTHENLTGTRFADEIGVQRSSVSHILSGRNNPSFEFIQKILLRYKNLSSEWLIMGIGTMYKKPEQMDLFASVIPSSHNTQDPLPPPKANTILSSPEGDEKQLMNPPKEINPPRKVEKILIFYTDKTFDEFIPGK
jgi:transcriptional regulator with XRE-family HTH domain